jgi:GNAT superfamily N-acetyltransferase
MSAILTLHPVPLAALAGARQAHFARLGSAPELYLELMLPGGAAFRLEWQGQDAGYGLLGEDRCLLELELAPAEWTSGPELLAAVVRQLRVPQVRCFSFDSLLLGLCLELGFMPAVEGCLCRELLEAEGPVLPPGLVFRAARPEDGPALLPHRHGVFDDDGQVATWIDRGWVVVLEGPAGWIGVGLVSPVWPHGPERDVGVLVHPDHRRQGQGERILRHLKRWCLDRGLTPTAGCAVDNQASRRALARAGFAFQHRLLRFSCRSAPGEHAADPPPSPPAQKYSSRDRFASSQAWARS